MLLTVSRGILTGSWTGFQRGFDRFLEASLAGFYVFFGALTSGGLEAAAGFWPRHGVG